MNKITSPLSLLLVLLGMAATAFAAPEAEYQKIEKTYRLDADGGQEYRCASELTLFTHTAMNGTYGESFIVYNPQYQEVMIHASYTVQKDGKIIEAPANAFMEVLPRFAADAPAYNHLKEMVVVHTGLELGATIFLDYSIVTKPGFYPALDICEPLLQTSPVKEYSLTVAVPENTPLSYRLYNSNAKETVRNSNKFKSVSWNLRNLPASSREQFQPENPDEAPLLTATTFASHPASLALLKQRFAESKDYESKAYAQFITEKATNDREKTDIIHQHVVSNLSLSPIPMKYTGFTMRDADGVLRSAYGTAAEKTGLLCSMLNAAGVKAEMVAVYPGNINLGSAGMNVIKGLLVKATVGGQAIYLTASALGAADPSARGSLDKYLTLDGRELLVACQPKVINEKKEITVNASAAKNGMVICTLPAPSQGIDAWHLSPLPSSRSGLFELPSLLQEEVVYTVKPTDGLKLVTPTRQTVLSKPCGKVTVSIIQKGENVEVVRAIELNKLQYTPAEYTDLRTLVNEWADPNSSLLIWQLQ